MRPLRPLFTFALVVVLGAAVSACDDNEGPPVTPQPENVDPGNDPGRAGDQDNEPQPLEDDDLDE